MRLKNKIYKNGFGMIEVVIGSSIISLVMFSMASVVNISAKLSSENSNNNKAVFLIEEGVEAVKIMRDSSWQKISSLTPGTNYYLNFNGTTWATTTTNTFVDGVFERKFVLSSINRDATSQDIVTSGGSVDTETKKLTVSVSWRFRNATTTKSVSTYITNMF
jgi:Tfp pilus assembly protein PilV